MDPKRVLSVFNILGQKRPQNTQVLRGLNQRSLETPGLSTAPMGPQKRTALMAAAALGHIERIAAKDLVAPSKGVNLQDATGKTALAWAAEKDQTESVRALLSGRYKADVNIQDNLGATPLSWASYNGNTDIVKILIDAGANVDVKGANDKTSLYYASFQGHIGVVKLLLEAHANTEIVEKITGSTPLMAATYGHHADIVKLLLKHGANIDNVNMHRQTALSMASEHGITDIMGILLKNGAKPDIAETTEGWTALHFACDKNDFKAAELLIANGADIYLRDNDGRTPGEIARHKDVISLFSAKHARALGGYSRTRRASPQRNRGARRSRPTARSRRGA